MSSTSFAATQAWADDAPRRAEAEEEAHRGVGDEHLPVYLDEFVFRHNRRATPMAAFQTLLGLSTRHIPTTYNEIIRGAT